MMKTITASVVSMVLLGSTHASQVRTWTNVAGDKTFEAEFKEIKGNSVTVIKDGVVQRLSLQILSEKDQQWLIKIRQEQPLREWTSKDGDKTFMAEFISREGNKVIFKKGFSRMPADISILSQADIDWINKNGDRITKQNAPAVQSAFAKKISDKTQILKGGRMEGSDVEDAKYYVLYFTASW